MGNLARTTLTYVIWTLVVFDLAGGVVVRASLAATETSADEVTVASETSDAAKVHIAWAIAVVTGLACLAAGFAVAHVGSAAMGAVTERPELMGRAILFVGLAEGIAIYGLLVAILLMRRM